MAYLSTFWTTANRRTLRSAICLTEEPPVTSRHPPVEDWATDFDHTDPSWVADPYPIWEDLRQRCPVAHSDRYGGTWLPVTRELVSEVAYDTEHFTSRSVDCLTSPASTPDAGGSARRPAPGAACGC